MSTCWSKCECECAVWMLTVKLKTWADFVLFFSLNLPLSLFHLNINLVVSIYQFICAHLLDSLDHSIYLGLFEEVWWIQVLQLRCYLFTKNLLFDRCWSASSYVCGIFSWFYLTIHQFCEHVKNWYCDKWSRDISFPAHLLIYRRKHLLIVYFCSISLSLSLFLNLWLIKTFRI